jgi:hypothetical protein
MVFDGGYSEETGGQKLKAVKNCIFGTLVFSSITDFYLNSKLVILH